MKLVGGVIILASCALTAQQALTNDEYRTSKLTRLSNTLFLIGIIVFVVGSELKR